MSVLTLIGITCYLLFGTSLTIKGVLPISFTQHTNEDVETPLLEANTSTLEVTSSNQPNEAIEGNYNPLQIDDSQERTSPSNAKEQPKHEIELAKQNVIGAWKVTSSRCVHFKAHALDLVELYSSHMYSCKYGCRMDR